MSGHPRPADPKCPPGHRLLLNMPDAKTQAAARAELVRTFGPAKGIAAVLVRGSKRVDKQLETLTNHHRFIDQPKGYRAYLPWSFGT